MDLELPMDNGPSGPQFIDEEQEAPSSTLELRSSKPVTEEDKKYGNEYKDRSNNAYQGIRQAQTESLSRSSSQENNHSSSLSTKKTPARAVFEDLPTAYMCITSGFAKSRSQNGSSSLLEDCRDGSASSLHSPLEPIVDGEPDKKYDSEAAISCATQSAPIYCKNDDEAVISATKLQKPSTAMLPIDAIDELSGFSTAITSPEQSSCLFTTDGDDKYIHCEKTAVDNTIPSLANQSRKLKRKSDHIPWMAEESTVGNIYRHYADSRQFDEENKGDDSSLKNPENIPNGGLLLSSQSDAQEKPSALDVRKQRRVDRLTIGPQSRPPLCGLPALPTSVFSRLPSNISQGLDRTSSYGDTRNLLASTQRLDLPVPKPTLSRSEGRTDLRLQRPISELKDDTDATITTANSNNPFRRSYRRQKSTSRGSYADYAHPDSQHQAVPTYRLPLEREVSDALRRASGFSMFSTGSASSSLLKDELFDHGGSSYRDSTLRKRTKNNNPYLWRDISGSGSPKAAAPAHGFYNEHAIPLSWIAPNQENAVRVPINREAAYTRPSTKSSLNPINSLEHQEEGGIDDLEGDPNDWETVGESRFGVELKDNHGNGGFFEESTIHRTGSSLANTSNDGTTSLYDTDIEDYGSTERITQHPGTIQYSSDYRQQDLSKTPTPVFPPIYREHKVNGYLADLARHRGPSSPFNLAPQPLENLHANPFRSPPPEDLSTYAAKRTLFQRRVRRSQKPNHFPPSTKGFDTANENYPVDKFTESISSSLTPTTVAAQECTYRTLNWNDEVSSPSSTLSHSKRQFLSPINPVGRPDRPSSWKHLMTFGREEKIERYNANEILHENARTASPAGLEESNWHRPGDGIELRNLSHHKRSMSTREHQPLIRGPPGAFYQGISRSCRDTDSIGSLEAYGRSSKTTPRYAESNDYPTNALRPLSLVGSGTMTPVEQRGRGHLHIRSRSSRVYRSAHATPRRLSWQQLYTEAQLQNMQEAAVAGSLHDSSLASNTQSGQDIRDESAYRELYVNPGFNQQLSLWTQETSARMDLHDKNKRFSALVLTVCAAFPPLLVLFALGRLDRVMDWRSKGKHRAFEDKHKKLALVLVSVWGFVFLVGLIIILVFRSFR